MGYKQKGTQKVKLDMSPIKPSRSLELMVYADIPPSADAEAIARAVQTAVTDTEPDAFNIFVDIQEVR